MADKVVFLFGVCFAVLATTLAGTFMAEMRLDRKYSLLKLQYNLMFTLLMLLLSRYLWSNLTVFLPRLMIWTSAPTGSRLCFSFHRLTLATFLALADLSVIIGQYFTATDPYVISRVAFLCLGLKILMLFNFFVLTVVSVIIARIKPQLTTRFNQVKIKAFIATVLSILMFLQGLRTAYHPAGIVNVTVPIAKLPLSLNGTKIAQLSDIHLGPSVGRVMLDKVVDVVLFEMPDIIVITGDLVDSKVKTLREAAQPLKKLQARYGTYFVTGSYY